jgi:two-component system, OmpR family, sensor kinase
VSRLPIRTRVTLAFVLAMAVVLAATGLFVYLRQRSQLDDTIDQGLASRAADVTALLRDSSLNARRVRFSEQDEGFTQVLTPGGRILYETSGLPRRPLLAPAQLREAASAGLQIDVPAGHGLHDPTRISAQPVTRNGQRLVVTVGAALDDRNDALHSLARLLLLGGAAALLLASLAGYAAITAALRPVEEMRRRAAEISAAHPGQRLPLSPAEDELRRLAETLNLMLGRLEEAIEHERAFVDDASHELRTPLAAHRAELELALRYASSEEELRAAIVSAVAETERLSRLAEDLLVLARASDGKLALRLEEVRATPLLEAVRDRMAVAAAAGDRQVSAADADGISVTGDRLRLEQALGNLTDNALRHGRGGVRLWARAANGHVRLGVTDEGDGFPADYMPRAFERFSRGDPARTGDGAGLGLAIVEAIARAHGGKAGAENRPGGGAEAWIELPSEPPHVSAP